MMLVVDTSVLIDHLRGDARAVELLSRHATQNVRHFPMLKGLLPAYPVKARSG